MRSPLGVRRDPKRLVSRAALPPAHPHTLRHACGFELANDGYVARVFQHYLGHKNVPITTPYTGMAPNRFKVRCPPQIVR
jgi:type 1 fimbriae regulatory protein FimE